LPASIAGVTGAGAAAALSGGRDAAAGAGEDGGGEEAHAVKKSAKAAAKQKKGLRILMLMNGLRKQGKVPREGRPRRPEDYSASGNLSA
jgi:hypothetical protein